MELGDLSQTVLFMDIQSDKELDNGDMDAEMARNLNNQAKALQFEIKSWMTRKNYVLETGIRHPACKLVVYMPPGKLGDTIRAELLNDFPNIEEKCIIDERNEKSVGRLTTLLGLNNHTPNVAVELGGRTATGSILEIAEDSDTEDSDVSMDPETASRLHHRAKALQEEIKAWMTRKGLLLETGIRYPERELAIYIPLGATGDKIKTELLNDFPGIEKQASITELKKGTRKRLAMHPGRTPVFFGDGTSATLGTFLRVVNEDKMFALSSFHQPTAYSIMQRDVFVKLQHGPQLQESPEIFRLGRVVGSVSQPSPVLDACLIEIDQGMYDKIIFSMQPNPLLYLKMHEHAEDLGAQGLGRLKVCKYGHGTKGTAGVIVEYSRDIMENGHLLTDNIVTQSVDQSVFATDGDSGSIIMRAVRFPPLIETDGDEIAFYDAISQLYMADSETGESFSFPLPRCLTALGTQVEAQLELATKRFFVAH